MLVEIFHNVDRDSGFGLNSVWSKPSPGQPTPGKRQVPCSHQMVKVFEYHQPDVPLVGIPPALLDDIFRLFNIGDDPAFGTPSELAKTYRSHNLRSLSVGDVVTIDGQAWSCESAGWKARAFSELNILSAETAEQVIRSRYEFRTNETLSVTVPWTGEGSSC